MIMEAQQTHAFGSELQLELELELKSSSRL